MTAEQEVQQEMKISAGKYFFGETAIFSENQVGKNCTWIGLSRSFLIYEIQPRSTWGNNNCKGNPNFLCDSVSLLSYKETS